MIVNPTSIKNLIKFSPDDVQVTRFSDEGEITLQVKYEIDLKRALRATVAVVEIQIQNPYNNSRKSVYTPQEALDSIRFRSRDKQTRVNKKKESILLSRKSDFTQKISNSDASKISTAVGNTALGVENIIEVVAKKDIRKKLKDVPVLQTPISRRGSFTRVSRSNQLTSRSMILGQGISPAAVIDASSPFTSTEEALQGTNPSTKLNSAADVNEGFIIQSLLGNILDIDSAENISDADTIPMQSYRTKETAVVVETLTFSKALYARKGTRVFIYVNALNESGNQVSSNRALIDLSQKESRLNAGSVIEASPGKTSLRFSNIVGTTNIDLDSLDTSDISIYKIQSDVYKSPTKKKLFDSTNTSAAIKDTQGIGRSGANDLVDVWLKKKAGPIHPSSDGVWEKSKKLYTGNVPELAIQSLIKAERQSLSSTTVARFISKKSPGFVELVFPGVHNHLATTNSFLGPNAVAETDVKFSALSAFLKQGRIAIYVSGLETAGTVMVVRRDLTLHESEFVPLNIADPVRVVAPDGYSMIFEDLDVKGSHIYEYRAKAFTRRGREITTTGKAVIEFKILNGNAVEVSIGEPTISVDRTGDLDVSFDIAGSVPKTSLSLITEILDETNLAKYFDDNIEANREQLSKLIAFNIDRVDLKTGEVESFGIVKGGTFSDKSNQKTNNVSPLKSGRKYRYVVSVCLREPDTLLENSTRTSIDKTTGKSYTFSPSKFLNPTVMSRGIIPATGQEVPDDIREIFNIGFVGVQKIVDVTTSEKRASVISVNAKKISKTQASIRWKVKGQTSAFDHFIVIGKKLGMSYIVGKHHNVGTNNAFEFVDKVSGKQTGEVTYTVVPVYSDYTHGTPVRAGRIPGPSTSRVKK
jgi:hypothetical protein